MAQHKQKRSEHKEKNKDTCQRAAQVQGPGKQSRNPEIYERHKTGEETRKVGLPCSLGPGGRLFA